MFTKCPIIKLERVDVCGRECRVEQPLHWTLVSWQETNLIMIKHVGQKHDWER
jgi:hypothetical protein